MTEIKKGDYIPEMLEEVLQHYSQTGKDPSFINSLNEWYDSKGFLTPRQYECLCKEYDEVMF